VVMDNAAKELTSELTGKPYETGDLSKELDRRLKDAVARYCGKEDGDYQFGDLSKEIDRRVKDRVSEYLGKEYEFGDITREVSKRRKAWLEGFLGKEAAEQYQVSPWWTNLHSQSIVQGSPESDYQLFYSTLSLETLPKRRLTTLLEKTVMR
jgi:hypothetical protein